MCTPNYTGHPSVGLSLLQGRPNTVHSARDSLSRICKRYHNTDNNENTSFTSVGRASYPRTDGPGQHVVRGELHVHEELGQHELRLQ
jgi:hypothetical protein